MEKLQLITAVKLCEHNTFILHLSLFVVIKEWLF